MWHTLVHHHAFRRLWIAATVDALGSWLLVLAVPVQVYALTGSATSTSLALAIQALPAVLIGPWAGVLADRFPRGTVLLLANVGAAAGVALILAAGTPGRVGFVYLGLAVENVAVCFLRPALQAATPAVVAAERCGSCGPAVRRSRLPTGKPASDPAPGAADSASGAADSASGAADSASGAGDAALGSADPALGSADSALASANALMAVSNSVWRIGGPLVGTYLAAIGWFPAVVCADLASYLVAAAIIAGMRIPAPNGPTGDTALRAGLRHAVRDATLRGLLAGSCLYWIANAALSALLVPFVTLRLHAPGQAVGYLITGLGLGYLCGSALSRRLLLRFGARTIIVSAYAAVGLCFLVMVNTTSLPVAVVAAAGSGVPGSVAMVATGHHVQLATPDGVRGRVSAAFHTSDAVAAVAGALAAPAVLALVGLSRGLVLLGAGVLAAAVLAAMMLPARDCRLGQARA